MRRKALIIGALGPFSGPKVWLEKGVWVVDAPDEGWDENMIRLEIDENSQVEVTDDGDLLVQGPGWIKVHLLEKFNKAVFLGATQSSRS